MHSQLGKIILCIPAEDNFRQYLHSSLMQDTQMRVLPAAQGRVKTEKTQRRAKRYDVNISNADDPSIKTHQQLPVDKSSKQLVYAWHKNESSIHFYFSANWRSITIYAGCDGIRPGPSTHSTNQKRATETKTNTIIHRTKENKQNRQSLYHITLKTKTITIIHRQTEKQNNINFNKGTEWTKTNRSTIKDKNTAHCHG